jgi:hypothetical protein
MLVVEGKTFSKFVEKKSYRIKTFLNYCPVNKNLSGVRTYNTDDYALSDNKERFYSDSLLLTEEDFIKHYGNVLSAVHFERQRVFIEECENKISIKYQYQTRDRRVGKKYFRVRKTTRYLTFNFKTKLFYSGVFSTKQKKIISRTMKINPTNEAIYGLYSSLGIDKDIKPDFYFFSFFEKIWDRLGITNAQDFKTDNIRNFYTLTTYLVNGVKVPNNWKKFGGTFFSRVELRKHNMNLVDAMMSKMNLKGSKVKKILNEIEWVAFDRMFMMYTMLGIDSFNQLPDELFDERYRVGRSYPNQNIEDLIPVPNYDEEVPVSVHYDEERCGRYWYSTSKEQQKNLINVLGNVLTKKEKERIVKIGFLWDDRHFDTLYEHIAFKSELEKLGEKVRFKFNSEAEFNEEHEEFSRLIDSYKKGEVERFYGDVDSLETPIEYENETYYPVLLRKTNDYEKESQHQRNCVRTYTERPECLIFSIRKGSVDGDDRITVEYQYRNNELINVQERARFNNEPSLTFSHVARIQLVNINLLYKLGTLKLPKMIKKYRNGKEIEQQAVFNEANLVGERGRLIRMTPSWDVTTTEFSPYYDPLFEYPLPEYNEIEPVRYDDWLAGDDLLP